MNCARHGEDRCTCDPIDCDCLDCVLDRAKVGDCVSQKEGGGPHWKIADSAENK